MRLHKGINQDVKPVDNRDGEIRFAKNVVLNDFLGTIVNEDGASLISTGMGFPANSTILGGITTTNNETVIFYRVSGDPNPDRIGRFNNDTYNLTEIVSRADLLFDEDYPIAGEYKYNFLGELIITFWDNNTEAKYINLDTYNPLTNVNNLRLQPYFKNNFPTVALNDAAGSLLTGAYYIGYIYETTDGTKTNISLLTGPVLISTGKEADGNNYRSGDEGVPTSYAIDITFTNVDTRFEKLIPVVIRKIQGVADAIELPALSAVASSLTYRYSGSETETTITIDEIIVDNPFYTKNKTGTQVNNQLLLANLETADDIGFQKFANSIVLDIDTTSVVDINTEALKFSGKIPDEKYFKDGEVYAMYIVFVLNTGQLSKAYHIPGRPPVAIEVPAPDSVGAAANTTYYGGGGNYAGFTEDDTYTDILASGSTPTFRVVTNDGGGVLDRECRGNLMDIDATANSGGRYFQTRETGLNSGATNNFAFWQNEDETYPDTDDFDIWSTDGSGNAQDTGQSLRGEKVRHHKFPSDVYLSDTDDFFRHKVKIKTIRIPTTIKSKIQGFFLAYGTRTSQNITVIDDVNVELSGTEHNTSSELYTFGTQRSYENLTVEMKASCNIEVRNSAPTEDHGVLIHRNRFLSFVGFDLLSENPQIGNSYLRIKKIIDVTCGGFHDASTGIINFSADMVDPLAGNALSINVLNHSKNNAREIIPLTAVSKVNFGEKLESYGGEVDFTNVQGTTRWVSVNNIQYVPREYLSTKPATYTAITEPQYNGGQTSNIERDLLYPRHFTNHGYVWNLGNGSPSNIVSNTLIILASVCLTKNNVYYPFYQQDLTFNPKSFIAVNVGDADNAYDGTVIAGGGDTIIGKLGLHLHAAAARPGNAVEGMYLSVSFPAGTRNACNLRNVDDTRTEETYYPTDERHPTGFVGSHNLNLDNNVLIYNDDYSSINNVKAAALFNPNRRTTNKFPYRIIRSLTASLEADAADNWRTFLNNEYYESVRNRGEITNIQVYGSDRLYIHHEDTLFITRDKARIAAGEEDIILGSADIFSTEPIELRTSQNGYGGTQHMFSCLLTKFGYVFIDAEHGNVFIANENQLELITSGLSRFFRDNLKISPVNGNPNDWSNDNIISGTRGITVGYDEKYERVIFSFKTDAETFTISYSMLTKTWASFHDYFPNLFLTARNKLFAVDNSQSITRIYEHCASQSQKCVFYDGNPQRSFIDVPINTPSILTPQGLTRSNPTQQKLFHSIQAKLEVNDIVNDRRLYTNTVDFITVWTDNHCSEKFAISFPDNIRQREDKFVFNKFRDILDRSLGDNFNDFLDTIFNDYNIKPAAVNAAQSILKKRRFVNSFIICRLEYSNTNGYEIIFYEVDATANPALK